MEPSAFHRPRWRFLVLSLLVVLASIPAASRAGATPISKNVTLLAHLNNYSRYSACCSYVHHDGREYAVLGTETGTSILNITDPSAPHEVAFIPGLSSFWREMKQYRTWLYVSTEALGGGVQTIRMTDPEHPVLVGTYTATFNQEHTVTVDTTRALLILNGTRFSGAATGMRVLTLADPENPVDIGQYTTDYVHDSWMRGTTLYAASIISGTMRVFDLSNPAFPNPTVAWTYPGAKSHSSETSKDGRYLYVCDEINYSTLKVFDMLDPQAHPLVYETTVNPLSIVHNVHVKRDTAFVAWYTEGVRLLDITDPTLPAEWGYYDTYAGFSGGYHGVWEVAPQFPSGTFIASDIESGLYIFRANPDYGIARVRVRTAGGAPISGADVICASTADSVRTEASGDVRLALAPGARSLDVKKFGYSTKGIDATVVKGGEVTVDVTLSPLPVTVLSGTVRRSGDATPLPVAIVESEDTPIHGTSTGSGTYNVPGVPVGLYQLTCYRAGYGTQERWIPVEPGVPRSVNWSLLPAAWYDSCDVDRAWSLADPTDNATGAGRWVRAIPNGTSGLAARFEDYRSGAGAGVAPGLNPAAQHPEPSEGEVVAGPVAPGTDATPGGGWCFVTGNGPSGSAVGAYDVDGGKTTLTTPPLNMAGMTDPTLAFQRWWHMNTPGEPDSMQIDISNDGVAWIPVRAIRDSHPHWHLETVRVKDFLASPGAAVRMRFVAQDQGPTDGIVEAGIDDFELFDAALLPVSVESPPPGPPASGAPRVTLDAPRPNPSAGDASMSLRLPAAGLARVLVYDVAGRRVATLFSGTAPSGPLELRWDGRDEAGEKAASGIYWIRAEAAGDSFTRRLVRLR